MQHSLRQRFTLLAATAAALTGLLLAPASPAQAVTKLTDAQAASQLSASAPSTSRAAPRPAHASGTYSHWNGYKVDISRSTCNDNYITSHYSYIGPRGDGYPMYQAASGNRYVNEGNHWDITYYTCGC